MELEIWISMLQGLLPQRPTIVVRQRIQGSGAGVHLRVTHRHLEIVPTLGQSIVMGALRAVGTVVVTIVSHDKS